MTNQIAGAKVGLTGDSFIGFSEESTYGTEVSADSTTQWLHILSENIGLKKTIQVPANIDSAFDDVNQVYVGREIVTGDIEFAVPYAGWEVLMLHICGAVSAGTPDHSAMAQNQFDLTSTGRYRNTNSPSLTIHLSRGVVETTSNEGIFTFAGCVITSATLSCDGSNEVRCRISVVGQSQSFSNASSAPTVSYPTEPIANGTELLPYWGTGNFPVTAWSITLDRNIDQDRFFQGNTQTEEPPMGRYSVTGNFTTEWDNRTLNSNTMLNDWNSGQARLLAFSAVSTDYSGTGGQWKLSFALESTILNDFPPNLSAQGRTLVTVNFTGYDNASGTQRNFRIYQETEAAYTE